MSQVRHTTLFAGQAIGLAEMFKFEVGKHRLEGPVVYTAELSSPDGPSTAGGKHSLQHLTLVPAGGGVALLIGSADIVDKEVELRTFQQVDEMHRERFKGSPFAVEQAGYDLLMEISKSFFENQKYHVTQVAPGSEPASAPALAPAPPASPSRAVAALPNIANLPPGGLPMRLILTVGLSAATVVTLAVLLLRR